MTDRAAVALALAAVAGAIVGRGPSPWVGALVVVTALAVHRPAVLVLGVFVLTGGLSARAEAGLAPPRPGPFEGWATMLTDPEAAASGVRADVRLDDGRHVQALARAGAGIQGLRSAQAGQRLLLVGRLERPPPGATWLAARHVIGVVAIDAITARSAGAPWMRAANGLRDLLVRGAAGLPARQQPLFLGFVLGDTRGQPVDIADDFRGAGLTHLLAVSGQNVAFVLALAGPMLRRLGLRARLPATLGVIAFFALLTRFEPSVLRASAMAALAVTASTLGREASSMRLLALAVTGLVVIDPFLVDMVGFQLSAGACLGIAVLSPVIARSLPLPRPIAEALAVTIGAQLGVAPVLVAVFGGIPVAGVPANLLAAPAAGPVMVWGLAAGIVAGLVGGGAATLLHWPTGLLIAWIAWVAHVAASLPLGEMQVRELAVVAIGWALVAVAHHLGLTGVRRAGVGLIAVAVVAPAMALRTAAPLRVALTPGAMLWRANAAVLDIDGRADGARLLEALRRTGVGHIDVVVARTSSASTKDTVEALRRRFGTMEVLTPSTSVEAESLVVGGLRVDVRPTGDRLVVEITLDAGASARGPPDESAVESADRGRRAGHRQLDRTVPIELDPPVSLGPIAELTLPGARDPDTGPCLWVHERDVDGRGRHDGERCCTGGVE
ncbi:MAG: competence protein ComEC [Acidimicrobiaceae bacterium]